MSKSSTVIAQLIDAVIQNDVSLVNQLLNDGANPNQTMDSAYVTALHYAAQNNSLEVIPLLVEAGADVFAQTEPDGHIPLDIAILHNHEKVMQLLLAYANEVDARSH